MLRLVKYPNDILSTSTIEFDFDNPIVDPYILEEEMILLMAKENGIGLAAPQVGLDTRVFTIMARNLEGVTTPFAVFNPKIISASEELENGEEGCLSFPGLFFHVKRPSKILVEFFDRDKNLITTTLEGIDARCFQHELDHLNGICFTDKISSLKLNRAITKQRKRNGGAK